MAISRCFIVLSTSKQKSQRKSKQKTNYFKRNYSLKNSSSDSHLELAIRYEHILEYSICGNR